MARLKKLAPRRSSAAAPEPPPPDVESQTVESEEDSRRRWTDAEEKLLIDCFKQIIADGHKSENGFRPGYLTLLENLMRMEMPNAGLKGKPHIESKLKQWRRVWAPLWDFLSKSGTGWNGTTHEIDATSEQWDELLRTNRRQHALMKGQKFPYYDDWCLIFGKDRANGNVLVGSNDDIPPEEEAVETEFSPDDNPASRGQSSGVNSDAATGDVGSSRKRKSLDDSNNFWSRLEAMNERSNEALQAAVDCISRDAAVERASNIISSMQLTAIEKAAASSRILNDRGLVLAFLNMVMEERKDFVESILQGSF